MSRSIFFAATPIHLMCIYELYKTKNYVEFELVVFFGKNEFANKQLYNTLEILGFHNYTTFPLNTGWGFLSGYILKLRLISRMWKYRNSDDLTVSMIDFRNSLMHSLRCFFKNATFILIDDGFATYAAYRKYLSLGIYWPVDNYKSVRGFFTRWLYFGTCEKTLNERNIELFSIYFDSFNLNRIKGMKNDFSALRELLSPTFPVLNEKNVFFIGTKQSERGVMKLDDELLYIDRLNNYWKTKGKKLFYIKKRSSSDTKIKLIKDLNIPCLSFDLPLEIAMINNHFIPGSVCSTGSTLLKTLPMLYKSIDYYLVDISDFCTRKEDKEILEFASDFFKDIKRITIKN